MNYKEEAALRRAEGRAKARAEEAARAAAAAAAQATATAAATLCPACGHAAIDHGVDGSDRQPTLCAFFKPPGVQCDCSHFWGQEADDGSVDDGFDVSDVTGDGLSDGGDDVTDGEEITVIDNAE